MKTLFSSIFVLALSCVSLSQSNLTIFNNGDYAFHVMLNGIKQNQFPQKNVTISNVSSGGHALKVVFANGASEDIDKKLYLDEPSDIRMSIEFKKGKGKLKIISYEPTKGVQTNSLAYRPNDSAVYGDATVSNQAQQNTQTQGTIQNTNIANSTTTVTTTTTNSTDQTPTNGNLNLNVGTTGNNVNSSNQNSTNGTVNLNVGTNGMNMNVVDPITGQAINMNLNMNMNGVETTNIQSNSASSTTTTTTTVTSTSSGTNKPNSTSYQSNSNNNNTVSTNASSNVVNTTSSTSQTNTIKGLAKIKCSKVLTNFDSYINQLKELNFESDQVEEIQKDLELTCLTSSQAYKIVEILTFESNRLDIAKFLSDRMINRDMAGDLLPLFTFDSNKVEYKNYIR
jgi:hypothetical protein